MSTMTWHESVVNGKSHFPLKILYVDTNETAVVNSPDDIESGKTFKVLKTNYIPITKRILR